MWHYLVNCFNKKDLLALLSLKKILHLERNLQRAKRSAKSLKIILHRRHVCWYLIANHCSKFNAANFSETKVLQLARLLGE